MLRPRLVLYQRGVEFYFPCAVTHTRNVSIILLVARLHVTFQYVPVGVVGVGLSDYRSAFRQIFCLVSLSVATSSPLVRTFCCSLEGGLVDTGVVIS